MRCRMCLGFVACERQGSGLPSIAAGKANADAESALNIAC